MNNRLALLFMQEGSGYTGNWGISSEIGCRTEGAWMHASEGGAVKGVRVKNVTVKGRVVHGMRARRGCYSRGCRVL